MRRLVTCVSLAFLGIALMLGYAYWQWNQCQLTVTNLSGNDVSQVTAIVGNVPVDMGTLLNGAAKTVRLYPPSESGLQIGFVGRNGHLAKGGNGYIEPRGYHVKWVIGPGDEIVTLPSEVDMLLLHYH
jgi:hypothetical protein